MMTLANYGIKSNKFKDPVSAKSLNKSLQIRNRAESSLKQCLKTLHRIPNDKSQEILATIEEYYSRVPFDVVIWNKIQTKQCVVNSILSLDYRFNPYRARNAFQIIMTMLLNLSYLPWHKEFNKIVTYSGKFRQDVSEPLIGAEEVLMAAGFEQESDEHPLHLILPEKKMPQVDGTEHVVQVIFDCMLAQVVMSDIITVLESSCKSSKLGPSQLAVSKEVNCYLWIQSYFRERSQQVTEKACSNIQELLNNITNHLTKLKPITHRVPSKIISHSSDAQLSHNKVGETPFQLKKEKLKKVEQAHYSVLASILKDASLLKLPDDLSKLPGQIDEQDAQHFKSDQGQSFELGALKHVNQGRDLAHGGKFRNEIPTSFQHLECQQQTAKYVPRSREFDVIDDLPGVTRNLDYERTGHPTRVDLPHNDREVLIPKQDGKFIPEHESCQSISYIDAHHGTRHFAQPNPAMNTNNHSSSMVARHRYHDEVGSMRNSLTSQSPLMSIKNSSSRFDHGAAHDKYEQRNADRPSNSRMHWNCTSCTFYNNSSKETCEMCGLRKLL